MATMIILTQDADSEPVMVNVDTVTMVTLTNTGKFRVHFVDSSSVVVKENNNAIAEKVRVARRD